jgi:hypothetical protein
MCARVCYSNDNNMLSISVRGRTRLGFFLDPEVPSRTDTCIVDGNQCGPYDRIACPYTSPYMRVRLGILGPTLIRSIHVLARDLARKMYPRRLTQSDPSRL